MGAGALSYASRVREPRTRLFWGSNVVPDISHLNVSSPNPSSLGPDGRMHISFMSSAARLDQSSINPS